MKIIRKIHNLERYFNSFLISLKQYNWEGVILSSIRYKKIKMIIEVMLK